MSNRIVISIGSNIDKEINLPLAVRLVGERCTLLKVSPVYETVPVGLVDQANFFNAAVLVETELDPVQFKQQVLIPIEERLNRVRSDEKNAPRTIDLDISLVNDEIRDIDQKHHVPDPDILKFPHVAVPIADLVPEMRHPETAERLADIAARLVEKTAEDVLWVRGDVRLWEASGGIVWGQLDQ
jgi:2-amino-4-hydroxy-6-hydroxymethyldihydropteridine diphosphokinase